jgi:hypothetical protein
LRTIRNESNEGVGGRNAGLRAATGDVIVCLDDDVSGLTLDGIDSIIGSMKKNAGLAGICFKVVDRKTGQIMNWVHKRDIEEWSDKRFLTYDITEGAVAFKATYLHRTTYYPEEFFLSHEGPDLALRLLNLGGVIEYDPSIVVKHSHSDVSRTNWRNYYYDTRNISWLAARNLPVMMAIRTVSRQVLGVLLYAVKDGFVIWWLKGLFDGIKGIGHALESREPLSRSAIEHIKSLKKHEVSMYRRLMRVREGHKLGG